MSSSEVSDYGRFSGQRSNFFHTCNRLSQYLKENGSFGDLSLGLSRNFVPSGNPRPTMDLLPMIEKSGQNSVHKPMNLFPTREESTKKMDTSVTKGGPEKAQMTIFYGGQVIVFNDFPADKAKEIMLLASSNGGTTSVAPKLPESSLPVSKVVPSFVNQRPSQQIASEMPIARKKSLARFFEKRKDRIVSKGPYPYQMMSSPKAGSSSQVEESRAWLGLGAHFPVKIEH